jgi:hypothetical protein
MTAVFGFFAIAALIERRYNKLSHYSPGGTEVICEIWAMPSAVIPAKEMEAPRRSHSRESGNLPRKPVEERHRMTGFPLSRE